VVQGRLGSSTEDLSVKLEGFCGPEESCYCRQEEVIEESEDIVLPFRLLWGEVSMWRIPPPHH
jgi:hypothetical protein